MKTIINIVQGGVLTVLIAFASAPVAVYAQMLAPTANTPSYADSIKWTPTVNNTFSNDRSSAPGACSTLTSNGLGGIVNCLLGIMDQVIILLMAGAVVYVIWGAFQMLSSEEKRKSGRDTIIYGVIGLFVMVSVWGLVNILQSTFNLRGSYVAPVQLRP